VILKALGAILAVCGTVSAATPTVYTVGVDHRTGRLIRVPARRVTRSVAARPVQAALVRERVVEAREIRPIEPDSEPARDVAPGPSLEDLIARVANQYGIRPSFVHAVIRAESNYNPRAVSHKGAVGLMQLMPQTAVEYGVRNRFDPVQNVEGGVRYLRHLLDTYQDKNLALAAYNAGPGAVERHRGVPPYLETRLFVPRVLRFYSQFRGLDRPMELVPPLKKFEGPRIIQTIDQTGVVRYSTISQ